jgi:hypothetical protein
MESTTARQGHLDAVEGREIVFCHACSNEWYRDDHGLECPGCSSDITEIVSPENDPRDLGGHHSSASTSPEIPPLRPGDDSDPGEADIEEHMGPRGFVYRRSVRNRPDDTHHHPGIEPVLERFVDMIQMFGPQHRYNPEATSPGPGPGQVFGTAEPQRRFGEPHVHRATFTNTMNGGTASVTIFSGPAPRGFGHGHPAAGEDPFQTYAPSFLLQPEEPGQQQRAVVVIVTNHRSSVFRDALRDLGPASPGHEDGPPAVLARSLHDILSLLGGSQHAVSGDAVYSQEALDRIVSSLMEQNPPTGAAPPASAQALQKLDRRVVDAELRGQDDKFDCSVCLDEMKVGDTIVSLPCKHFFHEDCVVAWLSSHNTCPVCRSPIEKDSPNSGEAGTGAGGENSAGGAGGGAGAPPVPGNRPRWLYQSFGQPASPWGQVPSPGAGAAPGNPGAERPVRLSRPPSQSQSLLNEAMRSISSRQAERERERGETSGFSYDTSRLQRRSSMSPTSPRAAPGEQGSRIRQRSPSESSSSRRSAREGESRRQSGMGPLSWLRDRFSGGGGNGNGSTRDERRG